MANPIILAALLIGQPLPFRDDGTMSAMARKPVTGPVALGWLGFAGDQVADPVNHGGPDKAVHLYPADHYGWWRTQLPGHPHLDAPGAFGENLSVAGLTEDNACLGDCFRIGSALVQVAQGRAPCWKLDHHFGQTGVMRAVVTSGRCGLYLRVIETGVVTAGDVVERAGGGDADWPVTRLFALLVRGEARHDRGAAAALASHPLLAAEWQDRARAFADRR